MLLVINYSLKPHRTDSGLVIKSESDTVAHLITNHYKFVNILTHIN